MFVYVFDHGILRRKNSSWKGFREYFDRTISRGSDATRLVETENGILGFHRLAIMGLTPEGMQPFSLNGNYLVCNGEIYGFEKIRERLLEKYHFASDSRLRNPASAL